jgi:amino acid transporter
VVAALTGFSYMLLSTAFPRAAGPAMFVRAGLGITLGRVMGFAVVAVAITSSATISLAFAGYMSTYLPLPQWLLLLSGIGLLCLVAMAGVKESVAFAAIVTVIEVGALVWVIAAGVPHLEQADVWRALAPPPYAASMTVVSGAFLAFFAFIGFEDIVNMSEETHDASRTVPLAIAITLLLSTLIYAAVVLVAAAFPDRQLVAGNAAPLSTLYAAATGRSGAPIAALATIAMINGILVQMLMASRVLYGMAREGMAPSWLGGLHAGRQTPARATLLVAGLVALLALLVPLLQLAELTSLVMLLIFATVNVSLVVLGRMPDAHAGLRKWWWWGIPGAAIALGLVAAQMWPSD